LQATIAEKQYKGVISISAPIQLIDIKSKLSSTIVKWNNLLDTINTKKGQMKFVENTPENPHINYSRNPISSISELLKLMNKVENNLSKISIPTLIIQGNNDPVVNPKSAKKIYETISSEDKTIKYVDATNHGIINGVHLNEVFENILPFLKKIFKK